MHTILWTISSIIIVFSVASAQDCTTPNGYEARCVPLVNCKPANDFIQTSKTRPMTLEERQFIGRLQCGNNLYDVPNICCATNDPNFISLFIENGTVLSTEQRFTDGSQLPSIENFECGVDFLANRIFGGEDAELNEFQWMALLQYLKPSGSSSFGCGGSLINRRYILTAAHCLVGDILTLKGQLISVRLGEHNLETSVDCVATSLGYLNCASPVLDIPVESAKAHPGYSTGNLNPTNHNDIGLVRLAYYVPEMSTIYPICIPPSYFESPLGTNYIAVGWGKTSNVVNTRPAIKQKVVLPLFNFAECQQIFKQIDVDDTQICAGGQRGRDSCNGDSGGPLMTVSNGVWIMEGLVSFGVSGCGFDGIPGIYTRVSKYVDWIRENLES